MTQTTIFIYGLSGKMGREIANLIEVDYQSQSPSLQLIGGTSASLPCPLLPCDVAVDFSHHSAIMDHVNEAVKAKVPLLVGTTGLSSEAHLYLQDAAKHIPILRAANTSIGVSVMIHLVEQAAKMLDNSYDIEIFETHHRQKIDAPSGTALALGKAAAEGQNNEFNPITGDRHGARQEGAIGYGVHRGGGIFGEHSIRFIGDEEVIEITHRCLSRRLFARGALKAALWLKDQNAGLYTMEDVLK